MTRDSLAAPLVTYLTKKLGLMNAFNARSRLLLVMCQFSTNIARISLKLQTQNVSVQTYWPVLFQE